MTQLEIDDAQERLTSSASTNHQSLSHSRHEKSSVLAQIQKQKTSTFTKKLLEFFKINALGYPNDFENYVVHHEASDCSLIANTANPQPWICLNKMRYQLIPLR